MGVPDMCEFDFEEILPEDEDLLLSGEDKIPYDDSEPVSEEEEGYDTLYVPPYSKEELEQLTEVTVPEGMTGIGSGAFYNCKKLVSVHLPESMEVIYNGAFKGCSALASINLPGKLSRIGEEAFKGCAALKEIGLPESGCWIERDAFSGSGLRSVSIPDNSGYYIDDGYFGEDEKLSIGLSAFKNCRDLVSVRLPRGIDWIDGFAGCTSLRSVSIPQGVTEICESAFHGCTALESVEFPEGLERIGVSAFEGCSSLRSADLPKELKEIDMYAFQNCTSLARVELPDTAEAAGGVFFGCSALADENGFVILRGELHAYTGNASEIVIPEGVKAVWYGAFAYNETVTRVVIPQGVEWLRGTFMDCVNLEEAVLPDTLKEVGGAAFFGCRKLKTVILPAGLETLGKRCFAGCENLEPVFCGKPSHIEEDAFADCSKVFRTASDLTVLKAKYLSKNSIAAVILDEGAESIAKRAFSGCTGLRSVLLPDSMKEIGEFAFADCKNLSFINLPEGVSTADWAFYGCENLHLDR